MFKNRRFNKFWGIALLLLAVSYLLKVTVGFTYLDNFGELMLLAFVITWIDEYPKNKDAS